MKNELYTYCNYPKKNVPLYMSNFRHISLENVVSRIVSKVITNRLKSVLPNVISDAQSAFVPYRQIIDNTTVAFEVLHRMPNKRKWKKRVDNGGEARH